MDRVSFVGPMDRVLLLRTLPMLEGLGPIQLAAIAQHAEEKLVPRGTTLRMSEQPEECVLLVVEGELETTESNSLRRFQRGDAVGFVEMLSNGTSDLVLHATVDTMTLQLDWDAQLDICEEHFSVVMQYVAYLAARLVEREQPQIDDGPIPLIAAQKFRSPLDPNERLLLLSRSEAFSSGCLDALSELAQHVEEVRWKKGRKIWEIGAPADHFLLLASGSLKCHNESTGDMIYYPGSVVGLDEALCQTARTQSAISAEATVAIKVHLESFIDILEDHFDLSLDVLSLLATRLLKSLQSQQE